MIRLVVALYLMLVMAVGPAACCCTFSRLTDRSAARPAAPAEQPVPASGCCDGAQRPAPADVPECPASPDRGDSPRCPCKQAAGDVVVGLPGAHDEAQEVSLRGALADSFCPSSGFTT